MKYFANILNPFAPILIKKLAEITGFHLTIDMIAPSHGAIWRENPLQIVEKYASWANAYQENQITIAYDTMWEGTTRIAHRIAEEIHQQSPDTVVKVFNIAKADKNEIMTEVFKSKAIAVGSPTVSNSYLSSVAGWLEFLKQLKFKNKRAAAFGCYGWSGESVKLLQAKLAEAGFEVIDESIRSQWNPEESDFAGISALVKTLLDIQEVPEASQSADTKMQNTPAALVGMSMIRRKAILTAASLPALPLKICPMIGAARFAG